MGEEKKEKCPYCGLEYNARGIGPHLRFKHGIVGGKSALAISQGVPPSEMNVPINIPVQSGVTYMNPPAEPIQPLPSRPLITMQDANVAPIQLTGGMQTLKDIMLGEGMREGVANNIIRRFASGDTEDVGRLYKLLKNAGILPGPRRDVCGTYADILDLDIPEELEDELVMRKKKEGKSVGDNKITSSVERKKKILESMSSTDEEYLLDKRIELEKMKMEAEIKRLQKEMSGETQPQQQVPMVKRPMMNSDGTMRVDATGNVIYEFTPMIQNDPTTMVVSLVGALSGVFAGKRKDEEREGNVTTTFISDRVKELQAEKQLVERRLDEARQKDENTKAEFQKLQMQMLVDKVNEVVAQNKTPKQIFDDLKENIDIGKRMGMVDTGAATLEMKKMEQDFNRWKYEQEKGERQDIAKQGFYKEGFNVVKDIIEKAPTLIEKFKGMSKQQPPEQKIYQDAAGNIYDENGQLIQAAQQQEQGYTAEDYKKFEEWRRGNVEQSKGEHGVGGSEKGANEGDTALHIGGHAEGNKRKRKPVDSVTISHTNPT